jgi:hypothetical protein
MMAAKNALESERGTILTQFMVQRLIWAKTNLELKQLCEI